MNKISMRFKDMQLQRMYAHMLQNPPHLGEYRRIGATLYERFWQGFDGIGRPILHTFGHAAHAAGQDYRKARGKDYKKVRL